MDFLSRSSAAAVPYCDAVTGFDDWLPIGLKSLLKLNFMLHSCSFRMVSKLLSKTARVGASMTSGGNHSIGWLLRWRRNIVSIPLLLFVYTTSNHDLMLEDVWNCAVVGA